MDVRNILISSRGMLLEGLNMAYTWRTFFGVNLNHNRTQSNTLGQQFLAVYIIN